MRLKNSLLFATGFALLMPLTVISNVAYSADETRSTLVISNSPVPMEVSENSLYQQPVRTREISASEISGASYYKPTETIVTRKISGLKNDHMKLQHDVASLSVQLVNLQRDNENKSAEYYAAVATINTQLQNGTTPGNPRLLKRFAHAETNLENLSSTLADMNQMAIDVSRTATEAAFLMEITRSAFNLSGAIEEDHIELEKLEDSVNKTVVVIDRISSTISDDITRTSTYLSSERSNLRTLSLAVTHGDLYGKSLALRPFANANVYPQQAQNSTALSNTRPLVKIRFDRANVEFEQPIYMAVNEALDRYPNAQFDLVAVHPAKGNAAEVAIESTRARRNAERVLRTLTQMGMNRDIIDMSYKQTDDATSSEVHLYIK